jgi:tetratricopeptide (TPR) repeat protein
MRFWHRDIRIAVLFLACSSLAGCGKYVQRHIDQGDVYFKAQKYPEAIAEYEKARRIDSDNPRANRQLGLAYLQLRDPGNAVRFLSKAESLLPADQEIRIKLGQLYVVGGKPYEAVREAETVLTSNPQNGDAYSLLGTAYLAAREPGKALDAYRRYVQTAPRSAVAHYLLAGGLVAARQTSEAKKEYEAALALSPNTTDALTQLVALDFADKQLDSAAVRVDRQIKLAPRNPRLWLLLGSVQAVRGDTNAAEAAYREANRVDPQHSEAGLALAKLYLDWRKTDQSLATVDELLRVQPRNVVAHSLRGDVLRAKGDYEQARQAYEQAVAINPRFAGAANNLAWLLIEKFGDKRRSYDLAAMAYKEAPENPSIADTFGWIVYQHGDYPRALDLLRKSAEKLPSDGVVLYHLGMALAKTGDTTEARKVLTRAVQASRFDSLEAARRELSALK